METDFTPGRDDICRHGACRHDPDGDRPHRGDRSGTYDGRSGGDSSGPIVDRAIAGVEHGQILTIHGGRERGPCIARCAAASPF